MQGPADFGVLTPRIVIISGPGEGIFSYSPVPGPDNLVASTGIAPGTTADSFGNQVLNGDTVYGVFGGSFFAVQLFSAGLRWYIGGAHESVPYTFVFGIGGTALVGGVTPPQMTIGGGANFGGVIITNGSNLELWLPPTGDTTGVKDRANLNSALSTSPITVRLLSGNFYFNQGLTIPGASSVIGGGIGATICNIVGPFTGSQLFNITGTGSVQDMTIKCASSTVTTNPAVKAVEWTGATAPRAFNLQFININGWCLEAVPSGTLFNAGGIASWLYGFNCAGGIHLLSNAGASNNGQMFIGDSTFQQIGVASGTFANLDALMIEDCNDILIANFNSSVAGTSGGTGSNIHIKGKCAGVNVINPDCGVFPGTGNAPSMLIEDSVNGSPTGCTLNGGILQRGSTCLTITGGANIIDFFGAYFFAAQTHGVSVTGTGFGLRFEACQWNFNNGANGTAYDVNWTGTAQGTIRGSGFYTAVGAGANHVTHVGNLAAGNCRWENNDLLGTGTTVANAFAAAAAPVVARNNQGYNPVGTLTVTVPATGVATAAQGVDSTFYIKAAAGGTTTITPTGGPAIVIAAAATVPVFVPANTTITPVFGAGNAPTWVVNGN